MSLRTLLIGVGLAGVGYAIYNYFSNGQSVIAAIASTPGTFEPTPPSMSYSANSTDAAGIDFIKRNEGFNPLAYWDYKAYSIGYGHQITGGDGLSQSSTLTEPQASALLASDVSSKVDPVIRQYVRVPLSQNQWNALADFIYNVGAGAFVSSTLLSLLNNGDYAGAAEQFSVWNKAGGSVLSGLVSRRQADTALFDT